jgi:peptide/nickel transport system substrate-binding protein
MNLGRKAASAPTKEVNLSHQKNPQRLLAVSALAAAVSLAVSSCTAPESTDENRSINIAVTAINANWNPFEGTMVGFPMYDASAVYEPLWEMDIANIGVNDAGIPNEFIPRLAEEFTVAEDRGSISIELRQDVDFVDGEHLNAAGVEKWLDALFASEGYVFGFTIVDEFGAEVTATGEYSLELTTTKAVDRTFLALMAFTAIASPAVVDDPTLLEEPVGTGPYVIVDQVTDSSITFERNENYWNPEAYDFDEVTLTVFSDTVAALNALKTEQVDIAKITPELAGEAEASGLTLFEGTTVFENLFILDRDGSIVPALADVRVRQAMNMAFDREAIRENLNGGLGVVSSQPFTLGQPMYQEGGDDRYPYDPEEARDLLAEAGYPDGFEITIPTHAGLARLEPIVQQSLADIGITVTFEQFPDAAGMFTAVQSGEYPVEMDSQVNGTAIDHIRIFFGGFPEPEAAELYDAIFQGSYADSAGAYQELGEYILEEAWYVPFSRPAAVWAARPGFEVRVGGDEANPGLFSYSATDVE